MYLISKSNKNSYDDGASNFFDVFFFEKGPHLNAVEKSAACSCNRRIVIVLFLTRTNLLLPKIKLQYMTSGLDMRQYETAP